MTAARPAAPPMRVHGIDPADRAYLIEMGGRRARVPETLVGPLPRHHDVYAFLARHSRQIGRAMDRLARGRAPRPPYDQIRLED